jgi:tRNA pseudouridine55 synthase
MTKGLFLFNKPSGMSSAQFLGRIKRVLNVRKIGHGGTLDPFASGLLVVAIAREYTKTLEVILKGTPKRYRASIVIGAASTTYDRTGEMTPTPLMREVSRDEVEEALKQLRRNETQVPPPYSAIKMQGKPAYERARNGEVLEMKPKATKLLEYALLGMEQDNGTLKLDIDLEVSSGFYIRSFAHDLGVLLGSDGYVDELVRTKIGEFRLESGLTLEDMEKGLIELNFRAFGQVQGVGYRNFAFKCAKNRYIRGYTRNQADGSIEVLGQAKLPKIQAFLGDLQKGPEGAKIESYKDWFGRPQTEHPDFSILPTAPDIE